MKTEKIKEKYLHYELEKEDVEGVLTYFEEEEDYMKCEEINNFIKQKWSLENTNQK